MHSDHYQGLSNDWEYGPIYCSEITKKVLLNKFPTIRGVIGLELNREYEIYLNKDKSLKATVTLYDANHIIGSVMFLFQGFFGRIFHTGDFRFDEKMFHECTTLYPSSLGHHSPPWQHIPKSLQIDELILDNTYCDPIFQFPKRDRCVREIISIIDQNKPCDVYISTYNLGKEEILIELAEHYNTRVVVSAERYKDLLAMEVDIEKFSTKNEDGWIFVKKWKDKQTKEEIVKRGNKVIKITPTGWANIKEYISVVEGEYIVPYSSHSNYKEIETFVASLRPAVLKCVVRENRSNYQKVSNMKQFNSYMFTLQSLKQTGYELLLKQFTDISTASQEYTNLMVPANSSKIFMALGLKLTASQQFQEDTKKFEEKMSQIIQAKNKKKLDKGVKLKRPEDNPELTTEDLNIIEHYSQRTASATVDNSCSISLRPGCCEDESIDHIYEDSALFKSNTRVKRNPPEEYTTLTSQRFPDADTINHHQNSDETLNDSKSATKASRLTTDVESGEKLLPPGQKIKSAPVNNDTFFDNEFV